jgi:hypothetical protein
MVARLTPDQKVACSIHVGFKLPKTSVFFNFPQRNQIINLSCELV